MPTLIGLLVSPSVASTEMAAKFGSALLLFGPAVAVTLSVATLLPAMLGTVEGSTVGALSDAMVVLGVLTAAVSALVVPDGSVFGALVRSVIVAVVCLSDTLPGLLDVAFIVLVDPSSVPTTFSVFDVPDVSPILVTVFEVPSFPVFSVFVLTFGATVSIVPAPRDGGLVVGMTVVSAGLTSVTFVSIVVLVALFLLLNGFD